MRVRGRKRQGAGRAAVGDRGQRDGFGVGADVVIDLHGRVGVERSETVHPFVKRILAGGDGKGESAAQPGVQGGRNVIVVLRCDPLVVDGPRREPVLSSLSGICALAAELRECRCRQDNGSQQ